MVVGSFVYIICLYKLIYNAAEATDYLSERAVRD